MTVTDDQFDPSRYPPYRAEGPCNSEQMDLYLGVHEGVLRYFTKLLGAIVVIYLVLRLARVKIGQMSAGEPSPDETSHGAT